MTTYSQRAPFYMRLRQQSRNTARNMPWANLPEHQAAKVTVLTSVTLQQAVRPAHRRGTFFDGMDMCLKLVLRRSNDEGSLKPSLSSCIFGCANRSFHSCCPVRRCGASQPNLRDHHGSPYYIVEPDGTVRLTISN